MSALRWAAALGSTMALLVACSSGGAPPVTREGRSPSPGTSSHTAPAAPSRPTRPTTPAVTRPNILVIEADDMRADELRWMPRTRHAIAASGLTFTNSFAPYPLCCPSRASFLTGEYAHNHGVLSHEDPFGFHVFDDGDTLATRLQTAGYRTALIGKYLNGYGEQPTRAGADSLHYVPPGWSQWFGSSDHLWQSGDPFQGGTYDYFDLVSDVNGTTEAWPGRYTTDVTARQTEHVLSDFGSGAEDPWFVWWTPIAPHDGTPDESDDPGRIPRSDGFVVDWQSPARPDWVKGRFDGRVSHGLGTPPVGSAEPDTSDKPGYIRSYPELTPEERVAERTVTRQRAEALWVLDARIAGVLRRLQATGAASRTLVVFTSDNGYYLGEHRKRQGKINLHEPSIRVPLLMAGPGIPHGHRADPVSTVDLTATLADYAGVSLLDPDGQSQRRTIEDGDQGWRRPIVLEGLMPERAYADALGRPGWPSRLNTVGIRLDRWKLVRYDTGEAELYDLWRDPLELNNLARDPGTRRIFTELKRLWSRTINCSADQCRQPLPDDLQVGPRQEEDQTRTQQRTVTEYFSGDQANSQDEANRPAG